MSDDEYDDAEVDADLDFEEPDEGEDPDEKGDLAGLLKAGPDADPELDDEDEKAAKPDEDLEEEEEEPEPDIEEEDDKKQTDIDPVLKASNSIRRIVIVPEDQHVTSDVVQITELAELLAIRAEQIAKGSPFMIDAAGLTDPIEIARAEMRARRCPLNLRREVGQTPHERFVEIKVVRQMTIPE